MKPLIIAIAGIKRSGSTVQYNLVRIALEMAGYDVTAYGHNYRPAGNPQEGEAHLIKRHPFDKFIAETADHIFLTDRPDEEILGSLERFNGRKPDPARITGMRKHFFKWEEYSYIPIYDYKMWQENKILYVACIINHLGLHNDVKTSDILKEFNNIKPPETGQDPKTLMFSNHITSV